VTNYDYKIDIFAIGCIMAELYRGDPLMPGTSEADMIFRLANLIGKPTEEKLFNQVNRVCSVNSMQNPSIDQVHQILQNAIPLAPKAAIELISDMI
jgi:male germ cell-associated kinase